MPRRPAPRFAPWLLLIAAGCGGGPSAPSESAEAPSAPVQPADVDAIPTSRGAASAAQ